MGAMKGLPPCSSHREGQAELSLSGCAHVSVLNNLLGAGECCARECVRGRGGRDILTDGDRFKYELYVVSFVEHR